jgi:hypothetical protein
VLDYLLDINFTHGSPFFKYVHVVTRVFLFQHNVLFLFDIVLLYSTTIEQEVNDIFLSIE